MHFAPPLFTDSFLRSVYASEIAAFRSSGEDARLRERMLSWAARDFQKETTAEAGFIDVFFRQTWGYWAAGERAKAEGYTLYPQFPVGSAGQGGGTGQADLALGHFGREDIAGTPQVLCELKDVRSGLDAPQRRKGNDRSPVRQCADYLKEASRQLYGNERIQPSWGLVSDMNEFRLYSRRTMPAQYQRFFVRAPNGECDVVSLIEDSEAASLQRFFFSKLLSAEMLLTRFGPSPLEKLLERQGAHEKDLENSFYAEYRSYREAIYQAIVDNNPGFQGTRGKLVRLTQRFLDRCIFILFCEDMGEALRFPPHVLRDLLIHESLDRHYDPNDTSVWHKIKRLFAAMRDGTPFGEARINRFNGGLFEPEPELEALHIPNHVFCRKGQGASADSMKSAKDTLLFFSATYNFGVRSGTEERGIGLYTLGRIFEQSITDLERMEADADNRPSIANLSKRKRDGVYYTPEWVTHYIVDETIGAHLRELRRKLDLDDGSPFSEDELDRYQKAISGKRRGLKAPEAVVGHLERLDTYADQLADLKVLDPACGSGAFLIQALEKLVQERRWVAEERERITGHRGLFDIDKLTKAVLTENLYGVDINPESVEITRLALWLHSALPDRPLCELDRNIVCGNSLVGPEFYAWRQQGLFSEDQQERINVFDYQAAFPQVFARGNGKSGFDCVIGNPPYVKLQNFRKVDPDVAEYLVDAKRKDGTPLYASTQTQNFDLYLPFLERGMELLNENGRMGYIAPNVWLLNEYGRGLRRKLYDTRRLERWIDFKDYQVFEEAITYTALQFYRGRPGHAIACLFAPDGKVAGTNFAKADALVPYADLKSEKPWIFAPLIERRLLEKLEENCPKLGDEHTIIVGVQTSADHIYHLRKLGPGRYVQKAGRGEEREVAIEDDLMRPLVSGEEAKRYQAPRTDIHILYPYEIVKGRARLFSTSEIEATYRMGWEYLCQNEAALRRREGSSFDDPRWHRFGRNQNTDKQHLAKLLVPRLVVGLGVAVDEEGAFCLDNVDVNGVLAKDPEDLWFLAGVLNGPVANFVWRRGSKPFQNNFRSANKQFIAPLPIPDVTDTQRTEVGVRARQLQKLHTEERDLVLDLERRLRSSHATPAGLDESWLFGDIGDIDAWKKKAPDNLTGRARAAWAKEQRAASLARRVEPMSQKLQADARLHVIEWRGELGLAIDGVTVLNGVFVDAGEVAFIAAQWRQKIRQTNITATFDGARLVRLLLDIRTTGNEALRAQVIELDDSIQKLDAEIDAREKEMNELLYDLYDLDADERRLIENDRR